MTDATAPAPAGQDLPPFTSGYVGGDIRGLADLARALAACLGPMRDTVTLLSDRVDRIVTDTGWYGDGAAAFRAEWEGDAVAATALAGVVEDVAGVVGGLTQDLAATEAALERQAGTYRALGVPIGADGAPPDVLPVGAFGPVASELPPALAEPAAEYAAVWRSLTGQADTYRQAAYTALAAVYARIEPPSAPGQAGGPSADDRLTLGGYLRSLWALPSTARRMLDDDAADARRRLTAAKQAWQAERDRPGRAAAGRPIDPAVKDAVRRARTELAGLHDRLDTARTVELRVAGSGVLDKRVGDLVRGLGIPPAARAGAEEAAGGEFTALLREIPVLDVLAVVGGTVVQAPADVRRGEPAWRSWTEAAAANAAGLVTGSAAAGGVVLAAAAAPVTVPLAAVVGATALVGGVGGTFGADLANDALHEPWDVDVHDHGVAAGVALGVGHTVTHAATQTWTTVTDIAGTLENTGARLWDAVF